MGMMGKMRNLAPAFIIGVGGLFVLFMVISDSRILEIFGNRSQNVGSINGQDISYQEFANLVERQREQQVQQTGQDIPEESMDRFRDQIWDALISQKIIAEQIEQFGITVTDDEIKNIILGPNPPTFLTQNFIDSTGRFDRATYERALFDPQNKDALIAAEEVVRQQQLQTKLQSYLFATVPVSESEIIRRFKDQSIKYNAEYLKFEVNSIPDNSVTLDDKDLKKYYDENLDKYKIDAQRKVKYVLFQRKPSTEDSVAIKSNLEAIVKRYKADTSSFKYYAEIYSENPYSVDTIAFTDIPAETLPLLQNSQANQVIGPVATPEGYVVYKVTARVPSSTNLVRASHILVSSTGDDAKDLEEANKLYAQLQSGTDFATLAKNNSKDFASATKGGDLGWFGKGQMVKEFEDAAFNGPIGMVQKPVKSNYGYHIIKVVDKTNERLVVEKIVNKIQPSGTTLDRLYSDASDFAYLSEKNGFTQEADLAKYNVVETPPFKEDVFAVPGLGVSKAIVDFAFNSSVNTSSDVFKVPAGYAVVMVSEIIASGFQEFEKVKNTIQPLVLREKKFEMLKSKVGDIYSKIKNSGNLQSALTLDNNVKFDSTGLISPSAAIPNVGMDYAFIDKALDSELNKISEPFKGTQGYYVIKVIERNEFDKTAYDAQRSVLLNTIVQQKRGQFFNQWLANLKKEADITDNRHLFYR